MRDYIPLPEEFVQLAAANKIGLIDQLNARYGEIILRHAKAERAYYLSYLGDKANLAELRAEKEESYTLEHGIANMLSALQSTLIAERELSE